MCCAAASCYRSTAWRPRLPFPAAPNDALAAWRWCTEDQGINAGDIVLAGDSAGGGLALALLVSLRNAGAQLPARAVLLSPWTDLTRSGASMRLRAAMDPVLTPEVVRGLARDYLGGSDPQQPLISPLLASLLALPPLLVQVGGAEVLYSDSSRLVQAARAAGVSAKLQHAPGCPHVYQSLIGTPEAEAALEAIRIFVAEEREGDGSARRPAAPEPVLPTSARAVRFDAYGGREVLYLAEVKPAAPGPGEAMVAVRAAGINPGEALIRSGAAHERYPRQLSLRSGQRSCRALSGRSVRALKI